MHRASAPLSANHDSITLRQGSLQAIVHPSLGARLGRLQRLDARHAHFDYLVPIEPHGFDPNHWQRAGCFPMLPFTNKFPRNTLVWGAQAQRIAPAETPAWLHGWGARAAWHVESVSPHSCMLSHTFAANTFWPWSYRASLAFELDAHGLTQTLAVINHASQPMPLGMGFHPYFALNGHARAAVQTRPLWITEAGSDGLPAARQALPGEVTLELREDTPPENTLTWFCEIGEGVHASIDYPASGRRVTLISPHASDLVVHHRAGEPFLCLEPCTHLAGQLDPFRNVAAPGSETVFRMRLALT